MMATFLIETSLAIYVGFRYSSGVFRTLACVLLLCLASFQLAEFQVCVGPSAWALVWGKVGLAGITLLPALGMHLIGTVTRKSPLIGIGYAVAAIYEITFLLVPSATGQPECAGNYVIIQISSGWFNGIYSAYYFSFLLLAMLELTLRLTQRDPPPGLGYSNRLIALMLAGYLSFTVPMAITSLLSPELRRATPSIMCGFALILAVILAGYVAPLYAQEARAIKRPAV
jgi:hypothetical protein